MPGLVQDRILARPAMCRRAVPSLILAAATLRAFGGFLSTEITSAQPTRVQSSRTSTPTRDAIVMLSSTTSPKYLPVQAKSVASVNATLREELEAILLSKLSAVRAGSVGPGRAVT